MDVFIDLVGRFVKFVFGNETALNIAYSMFGDRSSLSETRILPDSKINIYI